MKGFIKLATVAAAAGGLVMSTGCVHGGGGRDRQSCGDKYKGLVDPCWPERYNQVARAETLAPFQTQAVNGAVLDNGVWNYYFEAGSDKITAGGMERLDYLVRRRPAPPPVVYLQTARDLGYDGTAPEKFADARRDLDQRRADAVQKYLTALTAGRPTNFQVQVVDTATPGIPAQAVANIYRSLPAQFTAAEGGAVGGGGGFGGGGFGGGGGAGGGGGRGQ